MMMITELIAALDLVGQVYRSKDGSRPADAVTKVMRELSRAQGKTLAEWVEEKAAGAGARRRKRAACVSQEAVEAAAARMARADTQFALRSAIAETSLKAKEWQSLARKLTGAAGRSAKAARELVETYFSDQLLLQSRRASVRRQFG
jgi:hypothetical protein